jgi:hypothetical protein
VQFGKEAKATVYKKLRIFLVSSKTVKHYIAIPAPKVESLKKPLPK